VLVVGKELWQEHRSDPFLGERVPMEVDNEQGVGGKHTWRWHSERRMQIPVVVIQLELVIEWAREDLDALLAQMDACQIRTRFFAYGRDIDECRRKRDWLDDYNSAEICSTRLKQPEVVFITDRTLAPALMHALFDGYKQQKAILLASPESVELSRVAKDFGFSILDVHPPSERRPFTSALLCQRIVQAILDDHDTLVIGYLMKVSRAVSLAKQGLIHFHASDGVCFAPVEPTLDLAHQSIPFHMILHKATDWSEYDYVDNRVCLKLPPAFQSHVTRRVFCDQVDDIAPLMRRSMFASILAEMMESSLAMGESLKVPGTTTLINASLEGSLDVLEKFPLPFIIKSDAACGTSFSHKMIVVRSFDAESIRKHIVRSFGSVRDLIAQEYIAENDGYEMKVYNIGQDIHVVRRPLNAPSLDSVALKTAFSFDSQAKPRSRSNSAATNRESTPNVVNASTLTGARHQALEQAARWLRDKLGLAFFGFDVLLDTGGSKDDPRACAKLAIIDVNYFPSFKHADNAGASFRKALKEQSSKRHP